MKPTPPDLFMSLFADQPSTCSQPRPRPPSLILFSLIWLWICQRAKKWRSEGLDRFQIN